MRAAPKTIGNFSTEFDLSRPLASAAAVLREIFLRPKSFYLGLPGKGPLREPAIFVLLISCVSTVLLLARVLLFSGASAGQEALATLAALVFIALSPVLVAAFAGIYLLSVRTFIGKSGTFHEIYRMLAYAYGAMILFWIPVIQALAFTYMALVLMLIAIQNTYQTSLLTALVTTLLGYIPMAVFSMFTILLVASLIAG